jgi:hypothetical protein
MIEAWAATAPSETALVDTVREGPGGGGLGPGDGSGEPGSTGEDAPEQATAKTIAERRIARGAERIDVTISFSPLKRRSGAPGGAPSEVDRATSVPVANEARKGTEIEVERNRASAIVDARFRARATRARFPSRFAMLDGPGRRE